MSTVNSISGHWEGDAPIFTGRLSLRIKDDNEGRLSGTFMVANSGSAWLYGDLAGLYHPNRDFAMTLKSQLGDIPLNGRVDGDTINAVLRFIREEKIGLKRQPGG